MMAVLSADPSRLRVFLTTTLRRDWQCSLPPAPRPAGQIHLECAVESRFRLVSHIGSDLQDRVCGRYGVSPQPGLTRSTAPNMMASIATGGWLHDAMRQNEAHEPGERDEINRPHRLPVAQPVKLSQRVGDRGTLHQAGDDRDRRCDEHGDEIAEQPDRERPRVRGHRPIILYHRQHLTRGPQSPILVSAEPLWKAV